MNRTARIGLWLLGLGIGAATVTGQTIVWSGGNSTFVSGANWVGGVAPGAAATAQFGNHGGQTNVVVNSTTVGNLEFLSTRTAVHNFYYTDGTATLTLNGNFTAQAGFDINFLITAHQLNIALPGGEHVFDIGGSTKVLIMGVVGGTGHLTKRGTGTLELLGANTLLWDGAGGFNNGIAVEVGTLALNGGSINQAGRDVIVGSFDVGGAPSAMLVSNGGDVADKYGVAGNDTGTNATITVTGAGSTWTNSEGMAVGYLGTGFLNVLDGGVVTTTGSGGDHSYLGLQIGTAGTAVVSGTDSAWTTPNDQLIIGGGGTGSLTISDGGLVTNTAGSIGLSSGGSGTVIVDEGTWANSTYLLVGNSGTGALTISNGGDVTNTYSYIATQAGSMGTVGVDGVGSTWINSGMLAVGQAGTGSLNITGGGVVSTTEGYIGYASGSSGAATVSGTGSAWTSSIQNIVVGNAGTGVLTLTSGGVVNLIGANQTLWLGADGGTGTLNIGDLATEAAEPAGILNADSVTTGSGTGLVQFNTTATSGSKYYFTNNGTGGGSAVIISGTTALTNTGGYNVLTGANNYTGNTLIKGGTLALDGGSVTYVSMGPSTLTVGQASGDNGTLAISNGGDFLNANSTSLGVLTGSTGTVTVTGAGSSLVTWTNLKVGGLGAGYLTVSNGAVTSDYTGYVGDAAGSSGSVSIDGTGSAWNSGSHLLVGNFGNGSLDITNGAHVNAATSDSAALIHAGYAAGSTGTITVSGTGSQLKSYQSMIVGQAGTGTLSVNSGGNVIVTTFLDAGIGNLSSGTIHLASGGTLSNTSASVGSGTGSTGTAIVDGTGTTWTNSDFLLVGHSGTGSLDISNGGQVVSLSGTAGLNSDGEGTVTVDGAGSSWTTAEGLTIAFSGIGSLAITNGGDVFNTGTILSTIIGENSGSVGTALVDGIGSTWVIDDELNVGAGGDGTLDITGGGSVTSGVAIIGDETSATGIATVSGTGSLWTAPVIGIATDGLGSLTIENGGSVVTDTGYIGYFSEGIGEVTVDAGSWTNSTYLYVGVEGNGTLAIENGGTVTSPNTSVGNNFDGIGILTVDGTGSSLVNSDTLYVGSEGNGFLLIENGATVTNITGSIGNNAGGDNGAASVIGPGSTWTNTGSLIVGNATSGDLALDDQGLVTANSLTLGALASSSGVVTLENTSSLLVTNNLFSGGSGYSNLAVYSGSDVAVGGYAVVGNNSGSDGSIYLDGAGSSFTTGGDIYVGNAGTGTVYLRGGALLQAAGGSGTIRLGHTGGDGTIYFGYDGEGYSSGGILNASSITTESGTGMVVFGTVASAGSPFYLTKDGTSTGTAITIDGATAVVQQHGYHVLLTDSSYTGGTEIYSGTLVAGTAGALGTGSVTVYGGKLGVASGVVFSNPLTLNVGASLTGNGTFGSAVTIGAGVHLAPGDSPGTLTFASGLTLADNGFLDMEVQFATGAAGTGYDTVAVSGGALDLAAVSAGGFTLKLISLNVGGSAGNVSDFSYTNSYAWTVFSTTGITGFDANKFTLDLSGFSNGLSTGSFVLSQSGNNVLLNFTAVPEPSTYALLALGLGLAALRTRSRRKAP